MKITKIIIKINLMKIVLAIQLAVFGLVGLEYMGIDVPILRQVICFVYLTFIPGLLILNILKLYNKLDIIDTVLYSLGLSLSFLMFIGVLINYFYPLVGVSDPISEIHLVVTIGIVTILSSIYLYNKNYIISFTINIYNLFYFSVILLFLFLTLYGTYLLDVYDNNVLLLIQLTIISVIPIFIALDKFPKKAYPIALWAIALSLLFQNSLPSMFPRFTDNFVEYNFANIVLKNGYWDSSIRGNLNGMLAIVFLLPIFSEVCKISLVSAFKTIVPTLYSFVPLGLYSIYEKQINKKISFLACFFFISVYEFYTWAGLTMKQVAAGIFLVLSLLTIVNKNINMFNKTILFIIFSFSLAVSHYGTSYIFMFCIITMLIIAPILRRLHKSYESTVVSFMVVILYILFTLFWYIYTSGGSAFINMVRLCDHMINSIFESYVLPKSSYASYILFGKFSLSLQILKILSLVSVFFMIVGILNLFYKPLFKFNSEYTAFSIASVVVGASVFIGHMSEAATPDRIFHFITFGLSPFAIIGAIISIKNLIKFIKKCISRNVEIDMNKTIVIVSLYLMIYLLFNTGFVSEVILKDFPGAPIYISKPRIKDGGSIQEKEYLYREYAPTCDVLGGRWLAKNSDITTKIYADISGIHILKRPCYGTGINNIERLNNKEFNLNEGYVYFRKINNDDRILIGAIYPLFKFYRIDKIYTLLLINGNKIYDNGGAAIYLITK